MFRFFIQRSYLLTLSDVPFADGDRSFTTCPGLETEGEWWEVQPSPLPLRPFLHRLIREVLVSLSDGGWGSCFLRRPNPPLQRFDEQGPKWKKLTELGSLKKDPLINVTTDVVVRCLLSSSLFGRIWYFSFGTHSYIRSRLLVTSRNSLLVLEEIGVTWEIEVLII